MHDIFFKDIYGTLPYCLDLFRIVFSKREFDLFDWDTLQSEATVTIGKKESRADLVFNAKLNDGNSVGIVFLLEHKSYRDSKLMEQMLRYQTDRYARSREPIIPILIYHGRQRTWEQPLSFQEYLGVGNGLEGFKNNILNFKCRLLNVHDLCIERELISMPILYIMGKIWRVDTDVLSKFFTMARALPRKERKELVVKAINYAQKYNRKLTLKVMGDLEEKVMGTKKGTATSLLQMSLDEERARGVVQGREQGIKQGIERGVKQGIERGMERGIEQGRETVALKMLEKGADISFISQCTLLSEGHIRRLQKKT